MSEYWTSQNQTFYSPLFRHKITNLAKGCVTMAQNWLHLSKNSFFWILDMCVKTERLKTGWLLAEWILKMFKFQTCTVFPGTAWGGFRTYYSKWKKFEHVHFYSLPNGKLTLSLKSRQTGLKSWTHFWISDGARTFHPELCSLLFLVR